MLAVWETCVIRQVQFAAMYRLARASAKRGGTLSIPGGKKLIYTQIDMPLVAIDDFEELGKTDPMFAELAKIVAKTHNVWNPEAEKYLLAHAKKID